MDPKPNDASLPDGLPAAALDVRRDAIEAAKRMRERRKLHPLPDGTSNRDLLTFGRA